MMETYRKLRWINDGPRSETTRLPLNFPASKPSEQHFMQAMHQLVVPMLRWTMASQCLQWLCLRGGQSHVWFAPGSWLLQLLLFPYISSTWQIWRYSLNHSGMMYDSKDCLRSFAFFCANLGLGFIDRESFIAPSCPALAKKASCSGLVLASGKSKVMKIAWHGFSAGLCLHEFFPTSLCGVLVFHFVSRRLARLTCPLCRHTTLTHQPSFTHHFVNTIYHTHTQLCHIPSFTHHLSHTIYHTHNFVTYHLSHTIFVTHNLSHTTLSHTIFHTHTHNFVTYHLSHTFFVTHHLSHNFFTHHLSHTTLSHTIFHTPSLSHTIFHTQLYHTPSFTRTQLCHIPSFTHHLCHTPSFTHNFITHHLSPHHLSHTIFVTHNFAWQAWHLATSTFVSRGRRGS